MASNPLSAASIFSDKSPLSTLYLSHFLRISFTLWALAGTVSASAFECALPTPAGKRLQVGNSLSALVIFAQFAGQGAGSSAPSWSADLFNPSVPGSFTHFYNDMSGGLLQVRGRVLPKRYSALDTADAYVAAEGGGVGQYGLFNLQVLRQADADSDFGEFDNDGPDGVPNSGDDDGYVDIVFINLHTVPRGFFIGSATGLASLGLDADYISNDAAAGGGFVRVRSRFNGFGGTTQRGHTFSVTASTMCHEFGHVLGLTDLFDQSSLSAAGELDPEQDSAGIGKWGLMGLGTLGWGVEDGPNAFSGPTLAELGWVEVDVLDKAAAGLSLEEVFTGRRLLKIPVSRYEYFLLEYRRAAGSYYNRNIPQDGLLLWHVDERADNDEERHKRIDLVCADGLFADRGAPSTAADPYAGRDNLDFWSRDAAYASEYNGNQGDAGDPFDGVRYRRIAWDTNPALRAHSGSTRGVELAWALENMRPEGNQMRFDFAGTAREGHIVGQVRWEGDVQLNGDVVVQPGARLVLADGVRVALARGDARGAGFDPDRSELIVYGEVVQEGTAAFRSSAATPGALDWSGIFLMDGQALDEGALSVENARFGVVRFRLPPGQTTWSGDVSVRGDLLVPVDAKLVVEPGTQLFFSESDIAVNGVSPSYVELVVEGALEARGQIDAPLRFTTAPNPQDDQLWYGVRLLPSARTDVAFAQFDHVGFAFSGEIGRNGSLRVADAVLRDAAGGGASVTLVGEAGFERTLFTRITGPALRVDGSGQVTLRQARIVGNGQEGIVLNNASLLALDVEITNNGLLDGEDPRSGLRAVGGGGQKIELWNATVERNSKHGIELVDWLGEVELYDSFVNANYRDGLRAGRLKKLVFEQVDVQRNLGGGVAVDSAYVELWTSYVLGNVGDALYLGPGSTGAIEMGHFGGGPGTVLDRVGTLFVRTSTFERAPVGLRLIDGDPVLEKNRLIGNAVALRIEGTRVPSVVRSNAFLDNATAVENLTNRALQAAGNYWGTTDSTAIAGLMWGRVDFSGFLAEEPDPTAVEQVQEVPLRFALGLGYPNPFNAAVAIPFELGEAVHAKLSVYDALGRRVRTLVDAAMAGGTHSAHWDGRDERGGEAASGPYFYRLQAGDFAAQGRVLLLR